jgi:hypothetical protein
MTKPVSRPLSPFARGRRGEPVSGLNTTMAIFSCVLCICFINVNLFVLRRSALHCIRVLSLSLRPQAKRARDISKLEVIPCDFQAKNNFVNLLIPFIGVGFLSFTALRMSNRKTAYIDCI